MNNYPTDDTQTILGMGLDPTDIDTSSPFEDEAEEQEVAEFLGEPRTSIKYEAEPPQPIQYDLATQYLAENEKKALEVMARLLDEKYTAITKDNILEWSEALGAEEALKAHHLGGIEMLPEYYALFNLNSKTRAMMLTQLAVFAQLWKGITDSNDQTMEILTKKYEEKTELALEKMTRETISKFNIKAKEIEGVLNTYTDTIKIENEKLQGLVVKGENAYNGIEKAQQKALVAIEKQTGSFFETKFGDIVKAIKVSIKKDIARADITAKTHAIYIAGTVAIFVIGFGIGKVFH